MLLVEVLAPSGQVLATSQPLTADGVALQPTWTGQANLQDYVGQEVQLRFTMQDAKLYAFQIPDASLHSSPLLVKLAADFDFKYDMDVMPTEVDVDGADGNDWNHRLFTGGTANAQVSNGILTISSSIDNPAHYFTAAESTSSNMVPPVVDGVWPGKTNLADGWTIEMSVKVLSDLGAKGALAVGASTATNTEQNGLLNIKATGLSWGKDDILLGTGLEDNSDDYHVFRIVQDPNPLGEEENNLACLA